MRSKISFVSVYRIGGGAVFFLAFLLLAQAAVPPSPINLVNTKGNFWVNHTWQAGSGSITDSYNVSVNGTWTNGLINLYINVSLSPHGSSEIYVYAYNNSDGGSLSDYYVHEIVTLSNNVPVMNIIGNKQVNESQLLSFSITGIDADNDTLSCNMNSTVGALSDCIFSWIPDYLDSGTYNITFWLNDSYGGSDIEDIVVTVVDMPSPGEPSVSYSTGNFWINWSWNAVSDADSYEFWIYNETEYQ